MVKSWCGCSGVSRVSEEDQKEMELEKWASLTVLDEKASI